MTSYRAKSIKKLAETGCLEPSKTEHFTYTALIIYNWSCLISAVVTVCMYDRL